MVRLLESGIDHGGIMLKRENPKRQLILITRVLIEKEQSLLKSRLLVGGYLWIKPIQQYPVFLLGVQLE